MFWTVFVVLVITYFILDWLLRSLKVRNVHDKYVFITGCDSGFGRELAISQQQPVSVVKWDFAPNQNLGFKPTSKMCCLTLLVVLVVTLILLNRIIRSLKVGKFNEKSVFITGCDSGFGRELAIRLDSLGFHVFAGCLTEDGAKSLSENCSSRVVTIIVDVTKADSIEAARDRVKQSLPNDKGLWAVVNNAAISGNMAAVEFCSKQDFLEVLNTNLLGYFEVTRQFLPLVRKSKGRIVNASSVSGRLAAFAGPYTCAKYGVEAFSDILRREVYPQGIKVSVLNPGAFKTNLANLERIFDQVRKAFEKTDPEVKDAYGKDYVEKFQKFLTQATSAASSSLEPVIKAYVHAITARFPHTRYAVGIDSKYFFIPISYLPDCLSDAILRLLLGK